MKCHTIYIFYIEPSTDLYNFWFKNVTLNNTNAKKCSPNYKQKYLFLVMSNYGDNSNYDQNDSDSERGNGAKSFEDQLFKAQAREDLCAKLIPMYNNLMDVFSAVDDPAEELSLPEIVVVGSQVY